jgi:hypothetical protein
VFWRKLQYLSSPLQIVGKRPLGRPICRWVDNIKMDLRDIGWDGRNWIELAQDRDLCEHGDEPSGSLKLLGIF